MTLLFQYGSNCNTDRLNCQQRLAGEALNPRLAQTVDNYDIAFNVFSQGNGCAASNLVPSPGRHAWGVLYDTPDDRLVGKGPAHRRTMEQIEGPRYASTRIRVRTLAGQEVEATTFLAKKEAERDDLWTTKEYVEHIIRGLRQHDAPPEYVEHVITVAVEENGRARERADDETRRMATLRAL